MWAKKIIEHFVRKKSFVWTSISEFLMDSLTYRWPYGQKALRSDGHGGSKKQPCWLKIHHYLIWPFWLGNPLRSSVKSAAFKASVSSPWGYICISCTICYPFLWCCVGSYLRLHTMVFLPLIISKPLNEIWWYFDTLLSLINCTTYQNFIRFYYVVRLLSRAKNPGIEPVGMILPLTQISC